MMVNEFEHEVNPFDVFSDAGAYITTLNGSMIVEQNISDDALTKLKDSHVMRDILLRGMEQSLEPNLKQSLDTSVILRQYAKLHAELENLQQELWGFGANADFHRWFDLPGCTCPLLDNQDRIGSSQRIINTECPIHNTALIEDTDCKKLKDTQKIASPVEPIVMSRIKLNNVNFNKLANGKRTTIRLGEKSYLLGHAAIESNSGDVQKIVITEVRRIRFGDLGLQEATTDGFNTVDELREELERCYHRCISIAAPVTIVCFELYEESNLQLAD